MSKWGKVKLATICDLNMGQSPESSSYNQDGDGIPFYQGNADFGELNPKTRYFCNKPIKISKKDDILLSVRAPIGALNITKETCCIGRGLAALTAKENLTDTKFLYYVLKRKNAELNQKGTGSTFKAINKQNLRDILCPLPPLETQKQIAKTLDTAADLLAMRKQQLAELDNLIKSTFYDMFGDPATNEKGWKVEKLGSVLKGTPQNGLYKPSSDYTNDNLGTPILRIDSFYNGKLNQPLTFKRLYCTQKEIDVYSLSENDVVINRVNSIEYLGKCAHITGLLERTVFESNMMRLKVSDTIIKSMYLTMLLCAPYIYNQILSHAKKAVNQASINQKDVQDFNILIPPLSLQTQFTKIITKIEEQKTLVQKAIDETQYLFDSLMSEYFE